MNVSQTMENASLTFFQLLCFDVIVTTPIDKSDRPREILSALDRNAYTTSRPRLDDGTHSYVTVTLTFLNDEEHREHFRKLMFHLRLEFGDNIVIQGKGKYHQSAT